MLVASVLLRMITIASKYGSTHPERIQLIKKKFLNYKELTSDFMLLSWKSQDADIIERELQNSIKRNDIDKALFYFTFITEISEEVRDKLLRVEY